MAAVRFATDCDRCGTRSVEYSRWPMCRECGDDICDGCAARGTVIEADLDAPATCLCTDCQRELEAV